MQTTSNSCIIPKIDITSEDAKTINEEIKNKYSEIIEEENNAEQEGYSTEINRIYYEAYKSNNILSLIIIKCGPNDTKEYLVYNLNTKTGKKLTNKEILSEKSISETKFLNQLPNIYAKEFINFYGKSSEWRDENSYNEDTEQYNKTISSENYGIDVPMFLDKKGNIKIIAKIYSLTGAQYYYHIIDIEM